MTKENKISVVIKAEDEFNRAVGMGAMTSPSSGGGGGQDYGTGIYSSTSSPGASLIGGASTPAANAPSGGGTNLAYAQRLDAEREFQSQRLGIIRSALLEESSAIGTHLDEQASKEKTNNEIKKGNTKALIGTSLSLMQTLMSGSMKNNKAMFEAEKAYSVGKAIMSAYTAAARALKEYPAPMSYAVAASVLAKGMAMARSIASQKVTKSVGSGGVGGGGGGGAGGVGRSTVPYAVAEGNDKKGVQNLTVNIHNPLSDENWQKVVEDNIIPALEQAGDRNVIMKVNV